LFVCSEIHGTVQQERLTYIFSTVLSKEENTEKKGILIVSLLTYLHLLLASLIDLQKENKELKKVLLV